MDDLKVSSEIVNGYIVVMLIGEMSCFNSSIFTNCVEAELSPQGSNPVILDTTGLKFVDSCGVGALVSLYKKVAPAGGFVHIAGAQAGLLETLTITRLTSVFNMFPTVEDAMAAAGEAA